jgi:hypothetical protein
MRLAKPADAAPVIAALSAARLSKYYAAQPAALDALELYAWNAQVSAAFMVPAHFAEVLTRNAVSDALTAVYGPKWPWDHGFELSLPNPYPPAYNPRRDLLQVRSKHHTTGKVIADLKFVFWQKMFTARHDTRVWDAQILTLFPNTAEADPKKLRTRIYDDLEHIRGLRNRIAHHEPILTRNLPDDLDRTLELIKLRCTVTRDWVDHLEDALHAIASRP